MSKADEQAAAESDGERAGARALLCSVLDCIADPVIVTGPTGELHVLNRAACAFFGVDRTTRDLDALLSDVVYVPTDGEAPYVDEAPLTLALRRHEPSRLDVVLRSRHDGSAIHLHVTIDSLLLGESAAKGSVAVLHDVTAQKAAERSAREEAELSELMQTIAIAANNALTAHDAFQVCLDRVCAFMNWPVGHVYLKQGAELKSSGWWHDADPAHFESFRRESSGLVFSPGVGMIGQVLRSGQAKWIVDLKQDYSFVRAEPAIEAGLVSGFAFPVMIEKEVVAALEFYSARKEEADSHLLSLMSSIGTQLGRVIERDRARKAIEEQAEQVRGLLIRDELTGLHNRRGFLELARHHLRLAERMRRPALLFFFDLNGMKPINDALGHDEGDRALREMASVLSASFRGSDIIARLGGDEFVALLPDADPEQVDLFVGRVELEIAQRNVEPRRKYELSASIGASAFDPRAPEPIEDLLVRADALMYEQKRASKKTRDPSQPRASKLGIAML